MSSKKVSEGKQVSTASQLISMLNNIPDNTVSRYPSGLWGFNAVIESNGLTVNNSIIDFEFEIPFDDDIVPNESEITIYNLADSSVNGLKEGNALILKAGYGQDISIILNGKISYVSTVKTDCDKVTTIRVLDSSEGGTVNETFEANTNASYILRSLLEKANLPINVFNIPRDHIYRDATTVKGELTDKIKSYAEICGVSVYVNMQAIYCRPIYDGDNIHFTISADTGMIETPQRFEETNTAAEYQDTVTGYNIKMLLQPLMNTAAITDVKSKNCNGTYRVCSGKHIYDGLSATTEIKCIENISTEIIEENIESETEPLSSEEESSAVEWEKKTVPLGEKNYVKTFMAYQSYTDKSASGYKYLHGEDSRTDSYGFRWYKNCLCVAMGSYYGPDGTFVKVEWTNKSDGKTNTIICVKGDEKKDSETLGNHTYHPYEGGTGSVCEFIVDKNTYSSASDSGKLYENIERAFGIDHYGYITGIWTSKVYPFIGSQNNSLIDTAVNWAVQIAKDDSYYYQWGGWGPYGYDCGHFVITAYRKAGLSLSNTSYTGDMRSCFLSEGFSDVTASCNLSTGEGMKKGDVLLNEAKHAAMVQIDGGTTVEARSSAAGIVCNTAYRNYPWDCVLRYRG